jgi:sugar phosphate isomerase/epimerase
MTSGQTSGAALRLDHVCLSIYAFGYGAGFVRDDRYPGQAPAITLEAICDLCAKYGLGGIELPIDRYCPDGSESAIEALITSFSGRGLLVRLDLETFSVPYLRRLVPMAAKHGLGFVRAKVSNFYGGNRYRHTEWSADFGRFVAGVAELLPLFAEHGIRLLVENHQDIVLADYQELWRRFGHEWIGVNWDIGNSIPACETPLGFLDQTRAAVGNVHLKDYRLFECESGYRLVRCALGAGAIGLREVLPALLRSTPDVPMTIELGAMNARTADVNDPRYWAALPAFSPVHIAAFRDFLDRRTVAGGDWRTSWERQEPREAIIEQELRELDESVGHLRQLSLVAPSEMP